MNNEMKKDVYTQEYIPSIIKWGRLTNLLGILIALLPGTVCYVVYGIKPEFSAVITGFILVASSEAVFWVVEPVSYFSSLGIPGTYMSFLSGNISNLRLPVSIAARQQSEAEPGSQKETVISAIAIAVSVLLNIAILTLGVILGSSILSMVPQGVITALTNIVPALFGALLAQEVVSSTKVGCIGIALAVIMMLLSKFGMLGWVPGGDPTVVIMLVIIFGTVLIGRAVSKVD